MIHDVHKREMGVTVGEGPGAATRRYMSSKASWSRSRGLLMNNNAPFLPLNRTMSKSYINLMPKGPCNCFSVAPP